MSVIELEERWKAQIESANNETAAVRQKLHAAIRKGKAIQLQLAEKEGDVNQLQEKCAELGLRLDAYVLSRYRWKQDQSKSFECKNAVTGHGII